MKLQVYPVSLLLLMVCELSSSAMVDAMAAGDSVRNADRVDNSVSGFYHDKPP